MADDLKSMTNQMSTTTSNTHNKKKPKQDTKKKGAEPVDKEVWNITGGLFPMKPTYNNQSKDKNNLQKEDGLEIEKTNQDDFKWVYVPINQNNKQVGPIYHWIQESNKEKLYALEKFNIKCDVVELTDDIYNEHLKDLDNTWDFEETKYLWELVQRYDQRWIVIQDSYNQNRSVEDLKKRFYDVSKKILEINDQKQHPLYSYQYNHEYEKLRKFELEKYLIRNKEQNEQEKLIMEELRIVQNLIKKEEKELNTVNRILQVEVDENDILEDIDDNNDVFAKYNEEIRRRKQFHKKKYYLRSKYIEEPLPLPSKYNKRLASLLQDLNVPTKILPTQENEKLYDDLRENILKIFSITKYIQKKDIEKKRLQERLNQLKVADQQYQAHIANNPQQNQNQQSGNNNNTGNNQNQHANNNNQPNNNNNNRPNNNVPNNNNNSNNNNYPQPGTNNVPNNNSGANNNNNQQIPPTYNNNNPPPVNPSDPNQGNKRPYPYNQHMDQQNNQNQVKKMQKTNMGNHPIKNNNNIPDQQPQNISNPPNPQVGGPNMKINQPNNNNNPGMVQQQQNMNNNPNMPIHPNNMHNNNNINNTNIPPPYPPNHPQHQNYNNNNNQQQQGPMGQGNNNMMNNNTNYNNNNTNNNMRGPHNNSNNNMYSNNNV